MAVYTVVHLAEIDFAQPEVQRECGPFVASLAQVEESNHPGSVPGELSVPNAILNRRHWTAVGVLGSAHLVADQTDAAGNPLGFNQQRMQTALDKYFVSFLVTMLQRKTLNRAVEEAAEIFAGPVEDRPARTSRLRLDLLRFGVGGQFNQISSRHAHHRYYQLCREGLDVIPAWSDIRGILEELDADRLAAEQGAQQQKIEVLATQVTGSVRNIEHIQSVVHVIEYFFGVVYGAHLCHMLFGENDVVKHWFHNEVYLDERWYLTILAILGGGAGALFVKLVELYWHPAEK